MLHNSDPLDTARAALVAARATPRRQATVSAALDALERLIWEADQARRPRVIPFLSPLTPPVTRLDMIPRQEHVKRTAEVSLVGLHPIRLIGYGDAAEALAVAAWVNAYVPGLATVVRPCPCGNQGDPLLACGCTPEAIRAYRAQPDVAALLAADIVVDVPAHLTSISLHPGEPDEHVLERVAAARLRQVNDERVDADGKPFVPQLLDGGAANLLRAAMRSLPLSGRRVRSLLCVAASTAKLADAPEIRPAHLAEALQYRNRLTGEDSTDA
ncbi:hypothetical protein [Chloroflexus sp.]|uniref:magnesium chelatase subunit ChlI family protein n=1 Tax=Chloroflexus sp. TaxID=1904827 RepID=UPI002ACE2C99|nr:hypothetical protein [Chloroflexus sp.]